LWRAIPPLGAKQLGFSKPASAPMTQVKTLFRARCPGAPERALWTTAKKKGMVGLLSGLVIKLGA